MSKQASKAEANRQQLVDILEHPQNYSEADVYAAVRAFGGPVGLVRQFGHDFARARAVYEAHRAAGKGRMSSLVRASVEPGIDAYRKRPKAPKTAPKGKLGGSKSSGKRKLAHARSNPDAGLRVSRSAQQRARRTLEAGLFQPLTAGAKRVTAVANPASSQVQSLGFAKAAGFTRSKAYAWARGHGFKTGELDETAGYFWYRQHDPDKFGTIRSIELTHGVMARIGIRGKGQGQGESMGKRKTRARAAVRANPYAPSAFAGHTGYSVKDLWRHYDRALRGGGGWATIQPWHDELLTKGADPHFVDAALRVGHVPEHLLARANPNAEAHRRSAEKMAHMVDAARSLGDTSGLDFYRGARAAHEGDPRANPRHDPYDAWGTGPVDPRLVPRGTPVAQAHEYREPAHVRQDAAWRAAGYDENSPIWQAYVRETNAELARTASWMEPMPPGRGASSAARAAYAREMDVWRERRRRNPRRNPDHLPHPSEVPWTWTAPGTYFVRYDDGRGDLKRVSHAVAANIYATPAADPSFGHARADRALALYFVPAYYDSESLKTRKWRAAGGRPLWDAWRGALLVEGQPTHVWRP